jgi:hypothetical protein
MVKWLKKWFSEAYMRLCDKAQVGTTNHIAYALNQL